MCEGNIHMVMLSVSLKLSITLNMDKITAILKTQIRAGTVLFKETISICSHSNILRLYL